ncbi:uncharacterized protein [Anoplolepis gracilipes]|uniref:uncharacterized protein n=1 Tax=Anoplolepis gracilipes TaxID=354296 RepID=UPI003B9F3F94
MNTNKENKQYTATALKLKWKNLYDTYRVNIIKEKGRSGQAGKKGKPWRYMKQMSFLKDSFDLGIKSTVSNLTIPKEKDANLPNDIEELDDSNRSSDDFKLNKGKKKKREDPIEIIANALSQPIPPPQIVQPPLLPIPEIKGDKISYFCSAVDKKLRNFNKKQGNIEQCLKFMNYCLS